VSKQDGLCVGDLKERNQRSKVRRCNGQRPVDDEEEEDGKEEKRRRRRSRTKKWHGGQSPNKGGLSTSVTACSSHEYTQATTIWSFWLREEYAMLNIHAASSYRWLRLHGVREGWIPGGEHWSWGEGDDQTNGHKNVEAETLFLNAFSAVV